MSTPVVQFNFVPDFTESVEGPACPKCGGQSFTFTVFDRAGVVDVSVVEPVPSFAMAACAEPGCEHAWDLEGG